MKRFFLTLSFLSLFFSLSFTLPASAQTNPPVGPTNPSVPLTFTITNPFKVGDNLFQVMEGILDNIIIPLGGMLCVLAFIWGGFKYVTAQGKPDAIKTANKTLLYAAIGTALIFGAKAIELLVRTTFTDLLK
jgi:hypothetical protein